MPETKAESVSLEDFIAAATRGALRAMAETGSATPGDTDSLNPQPLPPGIEALRLPPGRIFIGIVPFPEGLAQ